MVQLALHAIIKERFATSGASRLQWQGWDESRFEWVRGGLDKESQPKCLLAWDERKLA